jgi:glycosyltransferase involved in cell wall biosynthesis
MKWLKRLRSRSLGRLRDAGDAARDRQDWATAASFYARYLSHRPGDFAIHVQRGHMEKENGALDRALASYHDALTLNPHDSDLLLSLGHLHKMRREIVQSYQRYLDSAEAGDSGFAIAEAQRLRLHYPGLVAHLPLPKVRARQQLSAATIAVTQILASASHGLDIIDTEAIELGESGLLRTTTGDPWVLLRPSPLPDHVRIAQFRLSLVGEPKGDVPREGRLFIDYGLGFDEVRPIRLPAGDGPVVVLLALPALIKHIRWDPDRRAGMFEVARIEIRTLSKAETVQHLLDGHGFDPIKRQAASRAIDRLAAAPFTPASAAAIQDRISPLLGPAENYDFWLDCYVNPGPEDYVRMAEMTGVMQYRPTFSFVVPTYQTPLALLRACIDSLLAQTYPDFEICIADDASPNPEVVAILRDYAARDPRVRLNVQHTNGHISAASNAALALATGEFVVLVDHDDVIPDYALFVVAHAINQRPDAQILYSDEDKIDIEGHRSAPYFKTEFSKFLMFGHNMISHLGIYRRSLVEAVDGFRLGLEGSQDYDLFLRCYERVGDGGVVHIPHVLYHWRAIAGSTAMSADQKDYAIVAAEAAIGAYFERADMPFLSTNGVAPGLTSIAVASRSSTSVSIIIPTRDGLDVLEPCVESVLRTATGDVEIIIVDNGSRDPATKRYLAALRRRGGGIKVVPYNRPFNFSDICNFGAGEASGDILCFLNNDTEVVKEGWIDRARALLSLEEVGIVGARLIFPDNTLQHFGIALGMGTHRVAGTPHQGIPRTEFGYFGKAALIQDFSAVSGACLFTRASTFDQIGGFDPELRVAYNDVDLCLRYRRAGLRVLCDPEIELLHKESRSRGSDTSPEKAARLETEALLMRQRWASVLDADPFWSPNHALNRSNPALAYPPRVPMPWRTDA